MLYVDWLLHGWELYLNFRFNYLLFFPVMMQDKFETQETCKNEKVLSVGHICTCYVHLYKQTTVNINFIYIYIYIHIISAKGHLLIY